MQQITFDDLRQANVARKREWPGDGKADLAFRALEVAGECGELAEAVKKYLRGLRGIKGSSATPDDIADEMADVLIALDLLAIDLDIDVGEAVARKFNKTSSKYGLRTQMAASQGG